MKKILFLMSLLVMLMLFVACDGNDAEKSDSADAVVAEVKTEEQMRIDENNAVILPKLEELEAIIIEIEKVAADNGVEEKYKSILNSIREDFDIVTGNHQKIIDMGGYKNGTTEFEAAVEIGIENDKEILALMIEDIEIGKTWTELRDKYNELTDIVNSVTVKAQETGWDKDKEMVAELGVAYGFMEEIQVKLESQETMELSYKEEKIAIIDELIPIFSEYLQIVSVPYTE